jgi:hypothetical protein
MGGQNTLGLLSPTKSQFRSDNGGSLLFHERDEMMEAIAHIPQLESK